ncbi:MAG: glycerate kinase [Pseudomonadota bacterium]|nr:glycerate kinase [Pseudomonadota bacterium]
MNPPEAPREAGRVAVCAPVPGSPAQVEVLFRLYAAALAAADPLCVLPPQLPPPPRGRTIVIGVGKAAAAMALAVERAWPAPLAGVVVVPAGATLPLRTIRQIEASHPLPDQRSVAGAQALLEAVSGLGPDDMVLALISGGGSALCALPGGGTTLAEKQTITRALLRRGANIRELNCVRKHLSAIKGGRLAVRAWPARVVSLVISDVPGDDPGYVASAPTLPDSASCADALAVLQRYGVTPSAALADALTTGVCETPKPDDARFAHHDVKVIASAQTALDAAAAAAARLGWRAHVLANALEGEARDLATNHAAIVRQVLQHGQPFRVPCILLSGGEATVTVAGNGRGGRNTEFALALAQSLDGCAGVHALSAGTDGLDGSSAAAGAWIGPQTLALGAAAGVDAASALRENDSFSYFEAIGTTVVTGPTFTNVNDFRALLIEPSGT